MAAYKEGAKTVLIPKGNVPDLQEVDDEVKSHIQFCPVSTLKEVLDRALLPAPKITKAEKKEKPKLQQEPVSALVPQTSAESGVQITQ